MTPETEEHISYDESHEVGVKSTASSPSSDANEMMRDLIVDSIPVFISESAKTTICVGLVSKCSGPSGLHNEAGPSNPSYITGACAGSKIVPSVPDDLIPKIGVKYSSLDDAIDMYREYARLSGFKVRLAATNYYDDDSIQSRYVRCNRYGNYQKKKPSLGENNRKIKTRKTSYKVTGCQARVKIDRDDKTGLFEIDWFEPVHNHPLMESLDARKAIRDNTLSFLDMNFILKVSTLNLGPTKAFNLNACLKGGYDRIRTLNTKFRNFWRDFISLIGPNDAGWVIDHFESRRKMYPNFFFKYKLKGKVLNSLFWADDFARGNYSKFSDVISVDATYHTNKYNLVFVPFTAINNHNKSVNVGAALLSDETIESYTWLLDAFLEVHGHAPNLVLSDQDPALTQAISRIFKESTHRLCMWHIMTKIPGKMSKEIVEDTSFKERINKLVWNINLEVGQFEEQWSSMISEFKLSDNKWLHDIYEIRERWIPAYFRHVPMCGLMKTTSRSESANSFFNAFTNNRSLLVNFMFNFDAAVTKQRYDHHEVETLGNTSTPILISPKYNNHLELHAASVYTQSIFRKVQKQIKKGLDDCFQRTSVVYEDRQETTIVYRNPKDEKKRPVYQVTLADSNKYVDCTCRWFNNFGYLCCHAFCVLVNNDVKQIPSNYIATRWQKDVIELSHILKNKKWGVFNSDTGCLLDEIAFYYERCVDKVVHDNSKLEGMLSMFKELDLSLEKGKSPVGQLNKTRQFIKTVIGVDLANTSEIQNPSVITNKGGNRRSRMISAKEKAMTTLQRKKRECKACYQLANHDSRNCPIKPSNKLKPHKKIQK